MKITKKQLKQIIKEELEALSEKEGGFQPQPGQKKDVEGQRLSRQMDLIAKLVQGAGSRKAVELRINEAIESLTAVYNTIRSATGISSKGSVGRGGALDADFEGEDVFNLQQMQSRLDLAIGTLRHLLELVKGDEDLQI